jgi:rubredoxin
LRTYTLMLKPHAETKLPDAACGDGLYVLILAGSALHADVEQKSVSLMFVNPEEGSLQITAGEQGLQALVLNFPRMQTASRDWLCVPCGFVYNEAAGLPEEGIAPGTRWQDIPADWTCPDCGLTKEYFEVIVPDK